MKIVIAPQFQKHDVFIRQIPRLIDEGEGTIVYDGRNRVVRLEHEGETMMVKCFKRVNIIQQIVYTFSVSQRLSVPSSLRENFPSVESAHPSV